MVEVIVLKMTLNTFGIIAYYLLLIVELSLLVVFFVDFNLFMFAF